MRRRQPPPPAAGSLSPFLPPEGPWQPAHWEAYSRWSAELDEYERAHPEAAEAVELVRAESVVPDAPFDGEGI